MTQEPLSGETAMEVQKAFAKWGKYLFRYYPGEHKVVSSEYAVAYMGVDPTITDLKHNVLMEQVREGEKLLQLFTDIDHGAKTGSVKVPALEKDVVYKVSLDTILFGKK